MCLQRFYVDYSMKNTPIPSTAVYKSQWMEKTTNFLGRMRWKAFHFLYPSQSEHKETFGFNTPKPPPYVEEMAEF